MRNKGSGACFPSATSCEWWPRTRKLGPTCWSPSSFLKGRKNDPGIEFAGPTLGLLVGFSIEREKRFLVLGQDFAIVFFFWPRQGYKGTRSGSPAATQIIVNK